MKGESFFVHTKEPVDRVFHYAHYFNCNEDEAKHEFMELEPSIAEDNIEVEKVLVLKPSVAIVAIKEDEEQ